MYYTNVIKNDELFELVEKTDKFVVAVFLIINVVNEYKFNLAWVIN